MKKLLTTLCVLALALVCVLVLPTQAEAATEGNYTYKVSNYRVATIIDCSTSISGNITIPSKLGGYSVTAIGAGAFSDCNRLTSVIIPDGVRDIGSSAFSNCSSLISATIPDSVNTIGNSVFSGCSSLKTIKIPFVGDSPKAANYFPQYPLGYLFGTSEYDGSTATTQCSRDFSTDTINRTYYIPNSLKSVTVTGGEILYGAFYNCSNLTSVSILNSTTSIRDFAFYNCSSLSSVTIPYSVTTIGKSAFYNCTSLGSVTIPYGVTTIGNSAFYNCTSLGSITIPHSVTTIGDSVFYNCSGLTSVIIGKGVTGIGNSAFYNCDSLTYNTYDNAEYLGNDNNPYMVLMKAVSTNISDCAIYADTRIVYDSAFLNCCNLTSVTIPDSVTTIGSSVFSGCGSLEEITVPFVGGSLNATIGKYQYPLGYYFGKTKYDGGYSASQRHYTTTTTYSSYYFPTSLRSVTVTGGEIPKGAFEKCRCLTSVTIGDSVTTIGSYAFNCCYNLTSVLFPDSVTTIGNYAFYSCNSITSMVVPDSVVVMGLGVFAGCNKLEEITIPFVGDSRKTAEDTYQYPFGYLFGTDSYSVGVPTKQYYYGYSLSSTVYDTYYIPASVKSVTVTGGSILHGAFYGCSNLTNITLMDGVTGIGDEAFYKCYNLTSVTIPDSVTTIGASAFYSCYGLPSIDIPNGITSIGDGAFCCCSFTSIVIPDSVTNIGLGVFSWCNKLEEITLPFVGDCPKTAMDTNQYPFGYIFGTVSYTNGISVKQYYYGSDTSKTTYAIYYIPASLKSVTVTGGNILRGAFYNCKKLTNIVLPECTTIIGEEAFYNCTGLTSITVPDSVKSIGAGAFNNCTGITDIIIPDSVNKIGEGAFSGCSSLETITIPFVGEQRKSEADTYQYPFGYIFGESSYTGSEETRQGYYGYNNSIEVATTYYLPSSLKTVKITGGNILYGAFSNCKKLTTVTLPDSAAGIGAHAFYNCVNLTSVAIGNGVITIGESAFYNCNNLVTVTIPDSVTSIGDSAFYNCGDLKTLTIGNGVTSIGSLAFRGCYTLTSITIPDSVTRIDSSAFEDCHGLMGIWVSAGNRMFTSDENGVLYNKDRTQLIRAPGGIAGSYTIPDGVTTIGIYAFRSCHKLTSVIIDNCVATIGGSAFEDCVYLKEVIIGDSVNTIGLSAFRSCVFLKTVTIGNDVTSIGRYAFYDCQRLNTVNFNAAKCTEMGSSNYPVFGGCTELATINIGKNVTQLPAFALSGCTNITSIIIPESVVYVGDDAFCDSTRLRSVWYQGSISDKENMQICAGNDYFSNANWHYNVCEVHTYDHDCDTDCNACDVTRTTTHDYADPTCIAPKTCKICGETVGDVLGHSFTNYKSNDDATCTDDGTESAKCDRCEETDTRTEVGTAKGHNYKSVVTPADCLKQGHTTHTCHCGDTYVDAYVNALGHDMGRWETTKEATCTEEGSKRKDCTRCDYFETDLAPATGHSHKTVVTEPTCTEQGYTTHTCHCGDTYVDTYVDALGHDMGQWETTKEATCTEEGSKRKDCSRCDYFEMAEIPAAGHSHDAVITEPTCTEQGYTTRTCYCGDSYVDTYVNALGHSFTDYKSNNDATCTEDGTETAKCDRCDKTDTRVDESSAKGHSYSKKVTKPTCTAKGYTTYTCACGDTYMPDEVEALGHSYDAGKVTKKATCKAAGIKTYTCKACGVTKTSAVAKLTKHTYSNNCDTTCNVCGGKRTIKHTYSNNCDTSCNVCKAKRTAPHTYSNSCDTSCNSCKAKRSIKHTYSNSCDTKCNVCKQTRKITHTYKAVITQATLTKNGKTVKRCSVCGKVDSTKTIKYAKTIKLSATSYTYDGKVKTPSVTVKDSGGKTLKKGTDYTVTYSAGRKYVGTYKVTVKLIGKYTGIKVLTFKIDPAKSAISKLTAGKGSITASWKASSQVTGYQIQYSTSKSFSGAKTVTIAGSTTKYTLKSLKGKKKYYVRVRTYKTVGKTTFYSAWSSSKNIKTK